MDEMRKRTWAEIHLDRLERNYLALRAKASGCAYMGLVKADAYGHGALPVSARLASLGADYLAVASLTEALELRDAGIRLPIIILGYSDPADTEILLKQHITQTIYDPALAEKFSDKALSLGGRLCCHLKADTGMSRLGILCDEAHIAAAVNELERLYHLPGLDCEGIFMHFADADSDPIYSQMQIRRFSSVLTQLEARGLHFRYRHACAGAATLNYPEAHLDMIRPGIPLYGYQPIPAAADVIALSPVMELKSRIISLRTLPKGSRIGYGGTYTLTRDSRVAVAAIGYGDGLPRLLSNRMKMLLRGERVPQIGRICMDMCMLDVTDVPGASMGDVVTVFGDGVPLQTLADTMGTITYEILCGITPRVPRIYTG